MIHEYFMVVFLSVTSLNALLLPAAAQLRGVERRVLVLGPVRRRRRHRGRRRGGHFVTGGQTFGTAVRTG